MNQLMAEKKKNEEQAKVEFEKRVKETKKKAMEDNMKKAEESGNKLTQTINDKGELIGINNVTTFDGLDENSTMDDVKKSMFNAENVVLDKDSDHGLSKLTEHLSITPTSSMDNVD